MSVVTVNTEKLSATAKVLAGVLKEEGVICTFTDEKYNEFDLNDFVHMLVRHAEDPRDVRRYLEITYSGSCTRLIANMKIVDGEAVLTSINAYDHPWPSEKINYERVDARLQEVLAANA